MLLFTKNIKSLGIYYLIGSFFGGVIGFSFSICLRLELNNPFTVLGDYFYNVCLTSHGLVMLFYFLTPIIYSIYYIVIYNYNTYIKDFLKLLSIFSYFLYLVSTFFVVFSLIISESVNGAWTLYTPLTNIDFNDSVGLDILLFGLNLFLISSIFNSIHIFWNSFLIILKSESWLDAPIIVWSYFLTSTLSLISTPSLFSVLVLLILDRNFGTYFFNVDLGGSVILFQVMFWLKNHPEVYELLIPVFGLISKVLEILCKGFLYNRIGIIYSKIVLFLISMFVFGHHMTTVGWGLDFKGFFMISTLIISLPTGVKVFSWVYSLMIYGFRFSIITGFVSLFLIFFSIGGVTGVFLANYSLDLFFHDSYFVVGHFHMILVGSSIFGYLSGLFLVYSEILNFSKDMWFIRIVWILFFIIFSLGLLQIIYFFHILGLIGNPRRVLLMSFNRNLNLHYSSISFLNIWFSFFLIIFLFLLRLVVIKI
uniref:cytochrome c oxidase subunit I n=1 Tax=Myxobolus shantungensis TaxID=904554 RepID=UPI00300145D5